MERTLIEATLEHFDGHRAKTANALGIGVRTLANKLRSYGYAPRAKTLARSAVINAGAELGNRQKLPITLRQVLPVVCEDRHRKEQNVKTTEL